jgi:hypothetical protein
MEKQREKEAKETTSQKIRNTGVESKKERVGSKTIDTEDSWKVGKWSPLRIMIFVNVMVLTHFL